MSGVIAWESHLVLSLKMKLTVKREKQGGEELGSLMVTLDSMFLKHGPFLSVSCYLLNPSELRV